MSVAVEDWHGCYEERWDGMIVREAFAHPAKFARGLVGRIVREGLARGWWRPGDVIGDPFGGVACGGLVCGYHGLAWRAVELEARFVELGNRNIALHAPRLARAGLPIPLLLQGDSRRFAEMVGGLAAAVTSPPYADSINDRNGIDTAKLAQQRFGPNSQAVGGGYGVATGQIGALPAGKLDAAISSPPYAETLSHGGGPDTGQDQIQGGKSLLGIKEGYGATPGQIGELAPGTVDAAITSPPYQDSVNAQAHGIDWTKAGPATGGRKRGEGCKHEETFRAQLAYGSAEGQIGAEQGETYWQAMRQVYASLALAVKPGGVVAVVVKDYVKDKRVVPLCDQTAQLLTALGFGVFLRARAMLVKESSHPCLFGGADHVTRRARKSFFRRMAEAKGSPAIDFEEVIVCRRGT